MVYLASLIPLVLELLLAALADSDWCAVLSVWGDSPVRAFIVDGYLAYKYSLTHFFFYNYAVVQTWLFVAKLAGTWFFVVWLRMNLLRFRFDQVASYTWHELVIFGVALLVQTCVLVWII